MKKIVSVLLAMLLAFAGAALAESATLSETTGLPTDKALTPIVVQMDNEPGARPQKGIASADVIYEVEVYNGGYTRYTVVFNDHIPELIEAIRSARIVNADISTDYFGAFVHYGGQKYGGSNVYDYFKTIYMGARFDGLSNSNDFYRDNSRKAPNNVVCKLQDIYNKTDWASILVRSPLHFNQTAVIPEGEDVTSFRVPYRDSYSPSYEWDASIGQYKRFYNGKPYVDGDTGEQVTCSNVIVQKWEYSWYEGQSDRPKVKDQGRGDAEFFIGGKHFTGYWERADLVANTTFYDNNGNLVLLNPGVTFIQTLKTEKSVEILG